MAIIFRDGLTIDDQTGKIWAVGDHVAEIQAQLGITPGVDKTNVSGLPDRQLTTGGWVDPANGRPTPYGVGMLKTDYEKQNGTSSSTNSSNTGSSSGTSWKQPLLDVGYTDAQITKAFGNATPTLDANGKFTAHQKKPIIKASTGQILGYSERDENYSLTDWMVMNTNGQNQDWSISASTSNNQDTNADTNTNTNTSTANTDATINAAYRKYFGRDAYNGTNGKPNEIAEWTGKLSQLDTFLQQEYKNANGGVAYGGTPIIPGTNTPSSENDALFNDLYNKMIAVDPFITEQLKDPALKLQFDGLSPDLKMQYIMNLKALGESIKAGKIVNPNLEITPEQATIFETQAKDKVKGYYDELIGNETGDLKTKLSRMKEDFTTGVGRAEDLFKENLSNQAESAAQSGLTFGSQRGEKVSKTIKAQQEGLDDASLEMARTGQDLATNAERRIGSSAFGNLGLDTSAQNYNVGEGGFASNGTRSLFTPQGNLVGEIPKQREVDVINEKNNLILAEKQKRILDASNLNGTPITDYSSVISTPAATVPMASASSITLPNGQRISNLDPNYNNYKKQYNL